MLVSYSLLKMNISLNNLQTFLNGIMVIATLITVALAITNSISPESTYFRNKISDPDFLSGSYEKFVRN